MFYSVWRQGGYVMKKPPRGPTRLTWTGPLWLTSNVMCLHESFLLKCYSYKFSFSINLFAGKCTIITCTEHEYHLLYGYNIEGEQVGAAAHLHPRNLNVSLCYFFQLNSLLGNTVQARWHWPKIRHVILKVLIFEMSTSFKLWRLQTLKV